MQRYIMIHIPTTSMLVVVRQAGSSVLETAASHLKQSGAVLSFSQLKWQPVHSSGCERCTSVTFTSF